MDENILFLLLFFLIVVGIIYLSKDTIVESYTPYSYGPFNYMDTGADPLSFYKYPIYRNPYMYPYQFYSSYPYPYMTYYPTNI